MPESAFVWLCSAGPLGYKEASWKMHFIYFLFPENPSDIEIYLGALVIGAVRTVICMDVMYCGGRERNL